MMQKAKVRKKRVITEDNNILRFSRLGKFSESAARYTSSIHLDKKLLPAVVAINSAHVVMLLKRELIAKDVAREILSSLRELPPNLEMKDELEDVHMNVENFVIEKTGKEIGGMMNFGKSRNDQVATALRFALRDELLLLGKEIVEFQKSLLFQARRHSFTIMPGYTHLQRGQPVTLGHHLLCYFDELERDFERLLSCYQRVNKSPMGAGALASTSLPISRQTVAKLLGFDSFVENSLDAVSSRDFATEAIYLCSQVMNDLSRLAEEIVLWSSKEFSFAEVPDEYASTSSMMPQKKNPVVAEITRAKASQVIADLTSSLGIMKALPLSYNLDLQELSSNLWSATERTISTLDVFGKMLKGIIFNPKAMFEAVKHDDSLFATDIADHLVQKYKLSFREAHNRVGSLMRAIYSRREEKTKKNNEKKKKKASSPPTSSIESLTTEEIRSILRVDVTKDEISRLLDPERGLAKKKKVLGSPNPDLVRKACNERLEKKLRSHLNSLSKLENRLAKSRAILDREIKQVLRSS
jgi:argininosuccinate lyase